MSETSSSLEPQQLSQPPPVEQKPTFLQTPEVQTPRQVTFGAIAVQENLTSDLLTPQEKALYKDGFAIFKDVVNAAENNINRMVLTTPEMVSGVVGLQSVVGMDTAEAGIMYQSFRDAGINFLHHFSMLEFGKERNYLKILVNDHAAENVLKTYQTVLGITLPDRPLQKDEILTYAIQLLNDTDAKRANLAHGLLSGFPLEDCQRWIHSSEAEINTIPSLRKLDDIDNRFGYQTRTMSDGKEFTGRPNFIANLEPKNYSLEGSRNQFLPDTRSALAQHAHTGVVEGFGLRWAAQIPPQAATVRHAQKLLQVDREVEILAYVNQQRNTFNVEDNAKAITIEKELLNKEPTAPSRKILGVAGLAFGIIASFASEINMTIMEPPNK